MNNFDDNSDFEENYDYEESYHRQKINSDNDSDEGNDYSDNDYQREKSELELLREKNIKERDAFLEMLMKDPEYADVVASANELKKTNINRIIKPKRDPSYRGQCSIPVEKRRSSRLQNIPPVFFKEDLIDEIEINRKRKRSEEYDYYDLETVIYHPKKTRASQNTIRAQIVPVDTITDSMIANIARKGTIKMYSDSGTSCHQCRQKTKDQKTYCRSSSCVGVRGQFCGVCLENRYGEDVALALKNPTWQCPVCRGICNCSFCRQKAGKRPTGILAPLAQQSGHKSVKDFLESLKGEGDYAHHDLVWKKLNDPNYLLGYSKDLKFAHMGRSNKHEIKYFLTWEGLHSFIREKENELESMIDLHDDRRCLLGFFRFTDEALLDDGTHCLMGPTYFKYEQLIEKMRIQLNIVEDEYTSKVLEKATRKHLDDVDRNNFNSNRILDLSLKEVDTNLNDKSCVEVPELTGKQHSHMEDSTVSLSDSNGLIKQESHELTPDGHLRDKSKHMLGSVEGTNEVLMADGICCSMVSDYCKQDEKENIKIRY